MAAKGQKRPFAPSGLRVLAELGGLFGASDAEANGRFPCFGDLDGLEAGLGGGDLGAPLARVFQRANL